jgi:hypothetical protein
MCSSKLCPRMHMQRGLLFLLRMKEGSADTASLQVSEAEARFNAQSQGKGVKPVFEASDLESLSGKYHTVACLDVFIHYPDVSTSHCRVSLRGGERRCFGTR